MGGQTPQEKAASELQNKYGDLFNKISGQDFQTKNLFENYKTPFDFGNFTKQLDELYNTGVGEVNRSANEDMTQAASNTAERLASQGINGGSIANSAIDSSKNPILKNKMSALDQLRKNKQSGYIGAMESDNRNNFMNTSASQDVFSQNMMNLFRKYGMMDQNLGGQQSNLGNLQDTNWFDDALGVINTAIPAINPLDQLFNGKKAGGGK